MLEDTSSIVLRECLEGYVIGHQDPSIREQARGLCERTPAPWC